MVDQSSIERALAARADPATGLLVPAVFLDRVDQALGLAQRVGQVAAVAVIAATDPARPGTPPAGTRPGYARALHVVRADQVRTTDTIGILGDEHVGVLLPLVRVGQAPGVIGRLLASADAASVAGGQPLLGRAGLAEGTAATTSAGALVEAAWRALDSGSAITAG